MPKTSNGAFTYSEFFFTKPDKIKNEVAYINLVSFPKISYIYQPPAVSSPRGSAPVWKVPFFVNKIASTLPILPLLSNL